MSFGDEDFKNLIAYIDANNEADFGKHFSRFLMQGLMGFSFFNTDKIFFLLRYALKTNKISIACLLVIIIENITATREHRNLANQCFPFINDPTVLRYCLENLSPIISPIEQDVLAYKAEKTEINWNSYTDKISLLALLASHGVKDVFEIQLRALSPEQQQELSNHPFYYAMLLFMAAKHGHLAMVEFLLTLKLSVDRILAQEYKEVNLDYYSTFGVPIDPLILLFHAFQYEKAGSCTPLYIASELGYLEIVQALLKAGASPHHDNAKKSPLSVACGAGHLEVARVLLDALKSKVSETEIINIEELLCKAIANNDIAIVQLLWPLQKEYMDSLIPEQVVHCTYTLYRNAVKSVEMTRFLIETGLKPENTHSLLMYALEELSGRKTSPGVVAILLRDVTDFLDVDLLYRAANQSSPLAIKYVLEAYAKQQEDDNKLTFLRTVIIILMGNNETQIISLLFNLLCQDPLSEYATILANHQVTDETFNIGENNAEIDRYTQRSQEIKMLEQQLRAHNLIDGCLAVTPKQDDTMEDFEGFVEEISDYYIGCCDADLLEALLKATIRKRIESQAVLWPAKDIPKISTHGGHDEDVLVKKLNKFITDTFRQVRQTRQPRPAELSRDDLAINALLGLATAAFANTKPQSRRWTSVNQAESRADKKLKIRH